MLSLCMFEDNNITHVQGHDILTLLCSCDAGEFATQTCFQGRFGEEMGNDQFGACIMFHAPRPNENLAIGRLQYVEVTNIFNL